MRENAHMLVLRARASGKDGCDWSVPDKREIQLVT